MFANNEEHLVLLEVELKNSLTEYKNAIARHQSIQTIYDSGDILVRLSYTELEYYRIAYLSSRADYERARGNISAYESSYRRVTKWARSIGITPHLHVLSVGDSKHIFN